MRSTSINEMGSHILWRMHKAHKLGTGIIVHESMILIEKEFRAINSRTSILTLKTDNFDMVLINAHAPIEN